MLEKIIELGAFVNETGERRVQLLHSDMVKTASSDIQEYWDRIEKDSSKCYLWVIGVLAMEYYGCNNNGDAFKEADLRKCHSDFVHNAHIYLHHVNKDPAKSIGVPVYSCYNEDMHRVELILQVDKNAQGAGIVVQSIAQNKPVYVSMGCRVAFDECSICGNHAQTRMQYCEHLKYNLRKILPDGRQVYALNPNPKFFDISIVSRPADPMAHTLDKIASQGINYAEELAGLPSSAELGEQAKYERVKLAGIGKLADLVKLVEGRSIASKDDVPDWVPTVRALEERGFDDVDFPHIEPSTAENMGLSPAGMLLSFAHCGALPGLSESAWMAGRSLLGRCPHEDEMAEMFDMLPRALSVLRSRPSFIDEMIDRIASSYNGEFDKPAHCMMIIRVIKPVASFRMKLAGLQKTAEFGRPPIEDTGHLGDLLDTITEGRGLPSIREPTHASNFRPITFKDEYGNTKITTPYHLRQSYGNYVKPILIGSSIALGLAGLGAMLNEPTLAKKLLYTTLAGGAAAALANGMFDLADRKEVSTRGTEVSNQTLMSAWGIEKQAFYQAALTSLGAGTAAGLGADYVFNKWRYGRQGLDPEEELGETGRKFHRAGKFVNEHPFTTIAGGGLAGGMLGGLIKGKKQTIRGSVVEGFRKHILHV